MTIIILITFIESSVLMLAHWYYSVARQTCDGRKT